MKDLKSSSSPKTENDNIKKTKDKLFPDTLQTSRHTMDWLGTCCWTWSGTCCGIDLGPAGVGLGLDRGLTCLDSYQPGLETYLWDRDSVLWSVQVSYWDCFLNPSMWTCSYELTLRWVSLLWALRTETCSRWCELVIMFFSWPIKPNHVQNIHLCPSVCLTGKSRAAWSGSMKSWTHPGMWSMNCHLVFLLLMLTKVWFYLRRFSVLLTVKCF